VGNSFDLFVCVYLGFVVVQEELCCGIVSSSQAAAAVVVTVAVAVAGANLFFLSTHEVSESLGSIQSGVSGSS
jgi:hypothetical protein